MVLVMSKVDVQLGYVLVIISIVGHFMFDFRYFNCETILLNGKKGLAVLLQNSAGLYE